MLIFGYPCTSLYSLILRTADGGFDMSCDSGGEDGESGSEALHKTEALAPRLEYGARSFELGDDPKDPIELFGCWLKDAVDAGIAEANALCLCTAEGPEPDGRMVLLKDYNKSGFSFFTNYESSKGRQLLALPAAAMVFWWGKLARQVRIRGSVARLNSEDNDDYFHSRPLDSKIGAWASCQSRPVQNRAAIDNAFLEQSKRYGGEVPRPPYWGGFILNPLAIEFWQGRDNRLHDRFLYLRQEPHEPWQVSRLNP